MTTTFTQVEILMRERRKGKTQEQAAAKANLKSRKTVMNFAQNTGHNYSFYLSLCYNEW